MKFKKGDKVQTLSDYDGDSLVPRDLAPRKGEIGIVATRTYIIFPRLEYPTHTSWARNRPKSQEGSGWYFLPRELKLFRKKSPNKL